MDTNLTSDIYGITEFVNQIKKDYFPANEESLMVGTLGYIGSLFSAQWQNQIIMTSQYSNEAIPTKAKFKRNVIAHALSLDSIDITATPATMDVQLYLLEDEVIKNLNKNNKLIIDCTQPFYVGDYEFRLDYDLIIGRTKIQNQYVYTAQYKEINTNPVSDLDNPYLKPPAIMMIDNKSTILINCRLRQVSQQTISKRIISSSSIENKTLTFTFENQLAAFNIDVTDGDITKRLTPVYIGMYDGSIENYFYYEYLDDNSIRIKFDSQSYIPKINTLIDINIFTTSGAAGVFKYSDAIVETLKSAKYGYSNIRATIVLATESTSGGHDSKSISELKKIIPKEALSRGNIATATDLNNYFDLINTADSKLHFKKKEHNQFNLIFYSHFIFRDNKGNILPTNTINLELHESDFDVISKDETNAVNKKLSLNPGTIIKYSPTLRIGTVCSKEEYIKNHIAPDDWDGEGEYKDPNFYYSLPFEYVVNNAPLYSSYYLNIIQSTKLLEFTWVNQNSDNQFIAAEVSWTRDYSDDAEERQKYTLSVDLTQNIAADRGIVEKTAEGEYICKNLRVFAVFYGSSGAPYMYKELDMTFFDENEFLYTFSGSVTTNDVMTSDDKLKIKGLRYKGTDCNTKPVDEGIGDFESNTNVVLYMLTKYDDGSHGLNDTGTIISGLDDWTLANKYKINEGIDFFYNYTNIISSSVAVSNSDHGVLYHINQVPMVKYDYLQDIDNVYEFIDQIELRRQYIDDCLNKLDGPMSIDFKFYNTYGPSETYYVDGELIDRVNIELTFRTKILSGADKYIKDYIIRDVKEYIENIDNIKDLHMPNITTLIEQRYADQIQYFQFVSINDYPTNIQHIVQMDVLQKDEEDHVPEFLNIDVGDESKPKITLIIDN